MKNSHVNPQQSTGESTDNAIDPSQIVLNMNPDHQHTQASQSKPKEDFKGCATPTYHEVDNSAMTKEVNRGKMHKTKDEYDEEIANYTRAIALNPNDASAFNHRGNAYKQQGQYDEALSDFKRAIGIDPEYVNAFINRGSVYYKKGKDNKDSDNKGYYDQAILDFSRAIAINPTSTTALNNRGNAYSKQGNYRKAIADYTRAITIDPKLSHAFLHRGNVYAQQGHYHTAIADYTSAITIDPEFTSAVYNRATVYERMSKHDKAKLDYDRVIDIDPQYAKKINYTHIDKKISQKLANPNSHASAAKAPAFTHKKQHKSTPYLPEENETSHSDDDGKLDATTRDQETKPSQSPSTTHSRRMTRNKDKGCVMS